GAHALGPRPLFAGRSSRQHPDPRPRRHRATGVRRPASASRRVPGSLRVRDQRSRQRTSPVRPQPSATSWCRSSLLRRAGAVKLPSRPTDPGVPLFSCWSCVLPVSLQPCCCLVLLP
ncbi:DNA methyl transferase8, partial [Zea mays]